MVANISLTKSCSKKEHRKLTTGFWETKFERGKPSEIKCEKMVRSKGLEPSRLLGTTTSRLRVYQFHHERIAGRGTWLKHGPIDKPFLPPSF